MGASAVASQSAATKHASLGAVLLERKIWLFFALGLGTGFPVATYWMNVFPRVDVEIDNALLLALTSFGIGGWLGLFAAPFLDRYSVPLFASLGHRRSWVAVTLAIGLAVFTLYLLTALVSERATARFAVISGIPALLVWGLLWISVDALRIDLYRGRAQAAAYTAQVFGSLAAWTIGTLPVRDWHSLAPAILGAALFMVGLGAVFLIKEPPSVSADEARPPSLPAALAQPWSAFFARHGRASGFLLAAIACYALAACAADFLGSKGYGVDVLRSSHVDFDQVSAVSRAYGAVGAQEITLTAIGAVAGLLIAFGLSPVRAFSVLVYANLALLALFALCKVWTGLTALNVAGLFALRTLIYGASFVIYTTVAARLTARPHTAGQYAMLALFVGLFWIGEDGFTFLASRIGTFATAAGAAIAGLAAIVLIRSAARVAYSAPRG